MKTIYFFLLLCFVSCTNGELKRDEEAGRPIDAITDTNSITKDSLDIPDSSAQNVTH